MMGVLCWTHRRQCSAEFFTVRSGTSCRGWWQSEVLVGLRCTCKVGEIHDRMPFGRRSGLESQSRDAFQRDLLAERGRECGISFTPGKFAAPAMAGWVVLAEVSRQRSVVRERMAANPSSRRVEGSIVNQRSSVAV